jgi:FkbM family methyltransferase
LYTLRIAKRLGAGGKVYAFEPHPQLAEILSRNLHINGLRQTAECFRLGLSDQNSTATFQYPIGHLGGGHVSNRADVSGHRAVEAEIRRLDDLLGDDFRADLVKIDVEGHEVNVLKGMQRIVEHSPAIKLLFEKLEPNAGTEGALNAYFSELGFELYGVQTDVSLLALGADGLPGWAGYVLAARPGTIESGLGRARFAIYPEQLIFPTAAAQTSGSPRRGQNEMLFHGPYWFLRQGVWRWKFHGKIRGAVRMSILERFGHHVVDFVIEEDKAEQVFVIRHDLVYFECAAFAANAEAEIAVERLEFVREG